MKRWALLCVVLLVLSWTDHADAAYGKARLLFNLKDPEITESSGVASSSYSKDVIFTHNDSGDIARFFAIGPKGQTIGTYVVLGAVALDWEDMARGKGSDGKPALFFADIGDNFGARPVLTVYEVAEPRANPKSPSGTVLVPIANVTHLIYEDGSHDSETLFIEPKTGALATVAKDPTGESGVYVAHEGLIPGLAMLHKVANISLKKLARPQQKSDFDGTSRLLTTGGDVSSDGRRFVVRTYVEAFEWSIANGLAAGLKRKPLRIPLPHTKQGEAIAYTTDGHSLITTSEQLPAPVHLVPYVAY